MVTFLLGCVSGAVGLVVFMNGLRWYRWTKIAKQQY